MVSNNSLFRFRLLILSGIKYVKVLTIRMHLDTNILLSKESVKSTKIFSRTWFSSNNKYKLIEDDNSSANNINRNTYNIKTIKFFYIYIKASQN